jgi:hypothetical protein
MQQLSTLSTLSTKAEHKIMTIKQIATFPEAPIMALLNGAARRGLRPVVSWLEPFEDFTLYCEQMGFTVDALPAWRPSTAVHVIGRFPNFWLRRLTAKERFERAGLPADKVRLEAVPLADLDGPDWFKVTIEGMDMDKAGQAARERPWER